VGEIFFEDLGILKNWTSDNKIIFLFKLPKIYACSPPSFKMFPNKGRGARSLRRKENGEMIFKEIFTSDKYKFKDLMRVFLKLKARLINISG